MSSVTSEPTPTGRRDVVVGWRLCIGSTTQVYCRRPPLRVNKQHRQAVACFPCQTTAYAVRIGGWAGAFGRQSIGIPSESKLVPDERRTWPGVEATHLNLNSTASDAHLSLE